MLRTIDALAESASVLAHEVKNPITGVNVALRALAGRLGEDEEATLRDFVGRLRGVELGIRRALGFAKPLEPRRERCDAAELLEAALATAEPACREAGVAAEVRAAAGLAVAVDRGLLLEALGHLLANAVEASPRGGRIVLRAEAASDAVAIRVEDEGPGLPERLGERAFLPFVTDKPEGTGMGLALARKIVEAHGGSLDAETGRAGGACLELRLPGAAASSAPELRTST